MTAHEPLTIVVSAGTYFRPFDRLIDWLEPWAAANPTVKFIVQHGPGRPLPGADNHDFLDYTALIALFSIADVVVLQGGAGGVMDARELGRIPIVVPRHPVNGEVVDDHQLLFSRKAAELGLVHYADSPEELTGLLDAAVAGSIATRQKSVTPTPGSANLSEVLDHTLKPLLPAARRRRVFRSIALLLGRGSRPKRNAGDAASAGKQAPENRVDAESRTK